MSKKKKSLGAVALTRPSAKGYIDNFNAKEAKGNISNTGLKTLVDVLLGATLGAGIGAVTGKQARFVGLGMIFLGHYTGDKSGVLRVAGASALAYGIAKYFENETLAGTVNGVTLQGETTKAKTRLTTFKDEVLATFYLDKVFKKKDSTGDDTADNTTTSQASTTVGSIDLSALELFDDFNHQEAEDFHAQLSASPDFEQDDYEDEYSVNDAPSEREAEYAYRIIDEDPDFSKM